MFRGVTALGSVSCLAHACGPSALLLCTHLCSDRSLPRQRQQIPNQNLLPSSCHIGCRICKSEEEGLWQVTDVRCTQVILSRRPCGWNLTAETVLVLFVTHANRCLSCSLFSPGTSGISLSHNFYSGSIFKSNSIWTSLSPQRLPPQWLEFTRFYNCGSRVSISTMSLNTLYTLGRWEPLGA